MRLDEKIKLIYEAIAPTITRTEDSWKDYLRFGSTVYKHPFAELENALLEMTFLNDGASEPAKIFKSVEIRKDKWLLQTRHIKVYVY
jgi:hypothetical protein